MGATRIFIENIRGLIEKKVDGEKIWYEPTEYGKVYRWFVKEYVPAHPRSYSFRDIRPEVGIVRLNDSCWGQSDSWLPDSLFGAENLKTTPETAAWFGIWNVLTHGKTRVEAISFHNNKYNMQHEFFWPLRGAVVYDELAGDKEMKDLKLVFLTGVKISPQTMDAVRGFVRRGGLCITLDSLAPAELAGKSGRLPDGNGQWLVVKDFATDEVREAVAPFLGKPDEIRYRVGGQILTITRGGDRNTIQVHFGP